MSVRGIRRPGKPTPVRGTRRPGRPTSKMNQAAREAYMLALKRGQEHARAKNKNKALYYFLHSGKTTHTHKWLILFLPMKVACRISEEGINYDNCLIWWTIHVKKMVTFVFYLNKLPYCTVFVFRYAPCTLQEDGTILGPELALAFANRSAVLGMDLGIFHFISRVLLTRGCLNSINHVISIF